MKKPLIILGKDTDHPELLESGAAHLSDFNKNILEGIDLLNRTESIGMFKGLKDTYGDGNAAERITKHIVGKLRR